MRRGAGAGHGLFPQVLSISEINLGSLGLMEAFWLSGYIRIAAVGGEVSSDLMQRVASQTILFQGDSITDCGRAREEVDPNSGLGGGYVAELARHLHERQRELHPNIYNRGISGHRIVDLYARWRVDAINLRPDTISILVGVNDLLHGYMANNGVEVDRFEVVYRMLLQYTKEQLPEVQLVLLEPFLLEAGPVLESWVRKLTARREVVRRLAEAFQAHFVPLQDPFHEAAAKEGAKAWLHDGIHPTPEGHALIAREWLRVTGLA